MEQLPEIFTKVYPADSAEVRVYGERLGAFSRKLQTTLDSLGSLRAKAQAGGKYCL